MPTRPTGFACCAEIDPAKRGIFVGAYIRQQWGFEILNGRLRYYNRGKDYFGPSATGPGLYAVGFAEFARSVVIYLQPEGGTMMFIEHAIDPLQVNFPVRVGSDWRSSPFAFPGRLWNVRGFGQPLSPEQMEVELGKCWLPADSAARLKYARA